MFYVLYPSQGLDMTAPNSLYNRNPVIGQRPYGAPKGANIPIHGNDSRERKGRREGRERERERKGRRGGKGKGKGGSEREKPTCIQDAFLDYSHPGALRIAWSCVGFPSVVAADFPVPPRSCPPFLTACGFLCTL